MLLWLLCAVPLMAAEPYRIMVVGDSISVGYTDNPNWTVPYQFGFRSGLYTRLTNSGMAFQFVGNSPEPWDGKFGVPGNVPPLDLRNLGQDRCAGYGGRRTDFIAGNIVSWLAMNAPDIVLLQIGINDISSGSTAEPTTAEANLNRIVGLVVTNSPNTRIIVAQITPYATYTDAITKYNNYIRNTLVPTFAAQGRLVTTVNQYTNLCFVGTTNIDASLYANGINHPNATSYDRMAQTWFAGIQALPPFPPQLQLLTTSNLVLNGGFETPITANNTHNINISGAGWTFTTGNSGAGSGIEHGDPYGSNGSWAIEGAQHAFLQSSGNTSTTRISRAVSGFVVGQQYQLLFQSKAITGFQGANPFKVRIFNGATAQLLFGGNSIVPTTTEYTPYMSEPFGASNSVLTLDFADLAPLTVQRVSWIDNVIIRPVPPVVLNGDILGGQLRLRFAGLTNFAYTVTATTNLAAPLGEWTPLGAAQFLSNNVFQFSEPISADSPARFYQVQRQ